jgi:hypothetical protein
MTLTNAQGPGVIAFITRTNPATQIQLHITRETSNTFAAAAETWRSKAASMAGKTGVTLTNLDFQTVPRGTNQQAALSFHAQKQGGDIFFTGRFWLEHDYSFRAVAIAPADIRRDDAIVQIFNSVQLKPVAHPTP